MDWTTTYQTLKNKLVGDRQKAWQEAAPPAETPPMDDAAKEKAYQDEMKGIHLRMGYGTITKEQHDEGVKAINKKYGRDQ